MKVAVVSDYGWPTGGVEQFVFEFLRHAASSGVELGLLTWAADAPVPVGVADVLEIQNGDVRDAWAMLECVDVVLVVTSFNVRMLARLVADYATEGGRTPVVVAVHTSGHSDPQSRAIRTQETWLSALLSHAAATVAVSEDVRAALLRLTPSADVAVISNGTRLSARRSAQSSAARTVGFIGRPVQQKGFHHFERLAQEFARPGLLFAANTVSIEPDRRVASIEYSARLTDDELIAFFERTHLLVVPYLRADGSPLAVLEALSCGVPMIGFDSPGVGDLLRSHGQHVTAPSYEALRAAMEGWINGRLCLRASQLNTVALWSTQIDQYLALLDVHTRHETPSF